MHSFVIVEQQVVAHACGYDAGALSPGLLGYDFGGDTVVFLVQMRHRLVEQDEVERLAQGADYGQALLLPYRPAPGR